MGIRISERSDFFHIPYGSPNSEGTPENNFVDLRANPSWIPALPSCIGWPETQNLLQVLNAPTSRLMSLATDQAYSEPEAPEQRPSLTSFITFCYAEVENNTRSSIMNLVEFLSRRIDYRLQKASNALQRSLNLEILIERQPTKFHHVRFDGWSLTIFAAAFGMEKERVRDTWEIYMTMLTTVIKECA